MDNSIEFVMGNCGSGKSTYLAKLATEYIKMGYNVYSNIAINGCRRFELSDLMVYDFGKDAILLFDESASMGLCSRGNEYKKNTTPELIQFFTTYRHYEVAKVVLCSPNFVDVLPFIRDNVNTIHIVNKSIFSILFLPINLLIALFCHDRRKYEKKKIRLSSIRFLNKKIVVQKEGIKTPQCSYEPVSFYRKFFILNKYYCNFDSFIKFVELTPKDFPLWNDINIVKKKDLKYFLSNIKYAIYYLKNMLFNVIMYLRFKIKR